MTPVGPSFNTNTHTLSLYIPPVYYITSVMILQRVSASCFGPKGREGGHRVPVERDRARVAAFGSRLALALALAPAVTY